LGNFFGPFAAGFLTKLFGFLLTTRLVGVLLVSFSGFYYCYSVVLETKERTKSDSNEKLVINNM